VASQTKILLLAWSETFWPIPNFLVPQQFWTGYATVSYPLLFSDGADIQFFLLTGKAAVN